MEFWELHLDKKNHDKIKKIIIIIRYPALHWTAYYIQWCIGNIGKLFWNYWYIGIEYLNVMKYLSTKILNYAVQHKSLKNQEALYLWQTIKFWKQKERL